jgi:hypothetical protein
MADRTDTPRPNGSGSMVSTADFEARLAAESEQGLEGPAPTHSAAVAALTHRLNRLAREVSESRQRGEQLKSSLDKSTRRMQQLIGERDRLASLLAERDAELQRLNRELGALTERAAPAVRGSPTFLAAASAMLGKFRHPRKAPGHSKPPNAPSAAVERSSTRRPLLPWVKDGSPKAVLGVVVFGLSEAEIESVLGIVERHCTERDLAPLLLTDNDAFQLFRGRRVLFEFLPARAEQERFAADLDWRLFTLRRLALIRRKWQPVRVIAFGRSAAEVVQLWLDSPFEVTPVPASLKGRSDGAELDCGEALQPSAVRA